MRIMLLLVNVLVVTVVAIAEGADVIKSKNAVYLSQIHENAPQIGKIDWQELPSNIRNKIVSQEISSNQNIKNAIRLTLEDHRKIFGERIGNILGGIASRKIIHNFTCQMVEPYLECVVWGEVERDFEKRNLAVVKKGNYLMLYKLRCSDAVLFWGPVAGTDEDHVTAGMTPGARYDKDALVNDLSRDTLVHARPT